jgi:predicted neutral ceramidase superfamily lipid hydrolase
LIISSLLSWLADISNFELQLYSQLIVFLVGVFSFPIIFSFLFSKLDYSEKRILPCSFIGYVSFGFLLLFTYEGLLVINSGMLFILGVYVVIGGVVQDKIIVTSLGKTVLRESFDKNSMKVNANIELVKKYFAPKKFGKG